MKPGGHLIICDDFLTDENLLEHKKAKPWLKRFQQGWLVNSLLSHQQINKYASQAGLEEIECQNLTPHLKLNRPRDYFIKLLIKVLGKQALKHPYFQMLYGGDALQKCLAKQWINHELIIWQKVND